MGWKKVLAITGIVLAVLVVAAGIAVYAFSRPATLQPYHDALAPELRDQNTQLALAMSAAGINDSIASLSNGTLTVLYDQPTGAFDPGADYWQQVALAAAAPIFPGSTTIVAIQFVNEQPALAWSVPTAKVLDFQANKIDASALEAAVTKTTA